MYNLTLDNLDVLFFASPIAMEWGKDGAEILRERMWYFNHILEILTEADKPMRAGEIAAKIPYYQGRRAQNRKEHGWVTPEGNLEDHRKVTARLKPMRREGLVERVSLGFQTIQTCKGPKEVELFGYVLTDKARG